MTHTGSPDTLLDTSVPIVLFADEWGGVGGTAGYVLMLARGLRKRGYRVAAICHGTPEMAPVRDELAAIGADVHLVPQGGRGPLGHLARLRGYRDIVRRYPGCVVALMMGYFTRGGGVTLAAKLGGASAVVRADLTPPEPPYRRRETLELRLKDIITDRVVVGAHENIDAFGRDTGRNRRKMHVIHTGIDLGRFEPGRGREAFRNEFRIAPDALVVGMTARLSDERKGARDFIEAAARVHTRQPSVHFLVVGEGVLRSGLEERAGELGLGDSVTFAGWRADIPAALAAMDAYVMPSHFEGGPTSVLEAMAMGLPVVATRVGMVPEVVDDGESGLIVAPGDVPALAESMSRLVTEADLRSRLGRAARERALADFSVDLMVERYLQAFEDSRRSKGAPTKRRREGSRPPVVYFTNSMMMGGMEAHILHLVRGMVAAGREVAVICPGYDVIGPWRRDLAAAGATVHVDARARGPEALRRYRRLRRVLREYPGHVFHLHNTGPDGGTIPILLARLSAARALVRTEHLPPDTQPSTRQRWLVHLRDRWLNRVIAVSESTMEEHIARLDRDRRKFSVVPNCVDIARFNPGCARGDEIRALTGAGRAHLLVGMVSRLAETRKGAGGFVAIAREIRAERDDVRFVIVGDGPLRADLERQAAGAVSFAGARDDTLNCYAGLDIFVMPSLAEGGPITILEAMAMGVPVVSTAVGMAPDVLDDGRTGLLVRPGDQAAIKRAVVALVSDPELRARLAREGRQVVEQRYTPEAMVRQTLEVYESE